MESAEWTSSLNAGTEKAPLEQSEREPAGVMKQMFDRRHRVGVHQSKAEDECARVKQWQGLLA